MKHSIFIQMECPMCGLIALKRPVTKTDYFGSNCVHCNSFLNPIGMVQTITAKFTEPVANIKSVLPELPTELTTEYESSSVDPCTLIRRYELFQEAAIKADKR